MVQKNHHYYEAHGLLHYRRKCYRLFRRITRIGSSLSADIRLLDQEIVDGIHLEIHMKPNDPNESMIDFSLLRNANLGESSPKTKNGNNFGTKSITFWAKVISRKKLTFINNNRIQCGQTHLLNCGDVLVLGSIEDRDEKVHEFRFDMAKPLTLSTSSTPSSTKSLSTRRSCRWNENHEQSLRVETIRRFHFNRIAMKQKIVKESVSNNADDDDDDDADDDDDRCDLDRTVEITKTDAIDTRADNSVSRSVVDEIQNEIKISPKCNHCCLQKFSYRKQSKICTCTESKKLSNNQNRSNDDHKRSPKLTPLFSINFNLRSQQQLSRQQKEISPNNRDGISFSVSQTPKIRIINHSDDETYRKILFNRSRSKENNVIHHNHYDHLEFDCDSTQLITIKLNRNDKINCFDVIIENNQSNDSDQNLDQIANIESDRFGSETIVSSDDECDKNESLNLKISDSFHSGNSFSTTPTSMLPSPYAFVSDDIELIDSSFSRKSIDSDRSVIVEKDSIEKILENDRTNLSIESNLFSLSSITQSSSLRSNSSSSSSSLKSWISTISLAESQTSSKSTTLKYLRRFFQMPPRESRSSLTGLKRLFGSKNTLERRALDRSISFTNQIRHLFHREAFSPRADYISPIDDCLKKLFNSKQSSSAHSRSDDSFQIFKSFRSFPIKQPKSLKVHFDISAVSIISPLQRSSLISRSENHRESKSMAIESSLSYVKRWRNIDEMSEIFSIENQSSTKSNRLRSIEFNVQCRDRFDRSDHSRSISIFDLSKSRELYEEPKASSRRQYNLRRRKIETENFFSNTSVSPPPLTNMLNIDSKQSKRKKLRSNKSDHKQSSPSRIKHIGNQRKKKQSKSLGLRKSKSIKKIESIDFEMKKSVNNFNCNESIEEHQTESNRLRRSKRIMSLRQPIKTQIQLEKNLRFKTLPSNLDRSSVVIEQRRRQDQQKSIQAKQNDEPAKRNRTKMTKFIDFTMQKLSQIGSKFKTAKSTKSKTRKFGGKN
ncbi:hypothetical protein SSS_07047 [Sarcoptes scabiei]|uniref:Uncharacterized protein n=1 Tax=Sarcoptes scabiei TaxID=52283 RepID=A0A834RHZ8_SARSC|nr:hypothetical protein SSS_07047 [Sarcoptes scabiei]